MLNPVPDSIHFPTLEEEILQFWKRIKAFTVSNELAIDRKKFTFYDGPPFATGLPHYGHVLAGTIKDVICRFAYQTGHSVDRRFGWDCHGMPVEYEVDKALGISGPDDVKKMGIKAYNQECRKIVMRYSKEWEDIITRTGRWIDFENDYKTMRIDFMETVWWVFQQLYKKDLVYKGVKVMPYSTGCCTPLSNFEAGQNYKDVDDPAVFISFPLKNDPSVSLVAWTTTPWTLPSNLAVCVHPEHVYVKILDKKRSRTFILMEARLCSLYKKESDYSIVDRFPGKDLQGLEYEPLFRFFVSHPESHRFYKVLVDTYVTDSGGTGIVQQAPYFGEDDYRVAMQAELITRDMEPVCPLDPLGKFCDPVEDFKGLYVKEADKKIIRYLKDNDRLIHEARVVHSYPFCWRSDTPLLYMAIPSYFIRVERLIPQLLKNNDATCWVPSFIRDGRFANWLKDARDWAISRHRYWGNPMPLWVSDDGKEVVCVGSVEELQNLSGRTDITDLHRENVDNITIPSKLHPGTTLKRVSYVFDCWFESGSMPYAQNHYPFCNKESFEANFPADFIAEGVDQTRGWFYTLLVLSTALFDKPPFKNLIVNGLVLAADGQKMSKRKNNYTSPMLIMKEMGADALRLYLLNSPVVRAETLRFKDSGVKDVVKDMFLPWYNAYRFFCQCMDKLQRENGVSLRFKHDDVDVGNYSDNYLDMWIVSFTQNLLKEVRKELSEYRLYSVLPRLVSFIDHLTNWFVRLNRKRLKGEHGASESTKCLKVLFQVLYTMTRIMAPLTPFIADYIYQNLKNIIDFSHEGNYESVHFLMIPQPNEGIIYPDIEKCIFRMQSVVEAGRIIRDRATMPVKYPLRELIVIHDDDSVLSDVRSMENVILAELNIKKLITSSDRQLYNVRYVAKPNLKVLGQRLKKKLGEVKKYLESELSEDDAVNLNSDIPIEICGESISKDDVFLSLEIGKSAGDASASQYMADSQGRLLVLLDITPDKNMLEEGLAREVISRIQKLRKKAGLEERDPVYVYYKSDSSEVEDIVERFSGFILDTVKQPLTRYPLPEDATILEKSQYDIKSTNFEISLVKRC